MFSRRDLMKYFGAGAVIVPIVGGKTEESATAQLIEVPKVRPVELHAEIPKPLDLRQVKRAALSLEMKDGTVRTIRFDSLDAWKEGVIRAGDDVSANVQLSLGRSSPQVHLGTLWMDDGILA